LNDVVARLEKMLRRIIGEDIELSVDLAPALGTIRADAGQLEQIVLNLSVNARDAMPNGGCLRITTQNVTIDSESQSNHDLAVTGDFIQLTVSDSGVGMDAETRRRIFEPFFTTKEVGKGTGLGLATVYGIVQQSSGHIRVHSELGHGTTFKIYFPRTRAAIRRIATRPPSVVAPAVSGTILVVEDESAVRQIALRILRHRGYTVLEARSPSEARAQCREHGPTVDLLLTDVVMPECSGLQLAQELTQQYPRMQVAYMSGYPGGAAARDGVGPRGETVTPL
jgi:CheY-like chemotaxis protein